MTTVTLNPADKSAGVTLSGGNLSAVNTATNTRGAVRSTKYRDRANGGFYYFEFTCSTVGHTGVLSTGIFLGLAKSTFALTSFGGASSFSFQEYANIVNNNDTTFGTALGVSAPIAGDVVGFAVDLTLGTVIVSVNGVNSTFDAGPLPAGAWSPIASVYFLNDAVSANFGGSAFAYLPDGYVGWEYDPRTPHNPTKQPASQRPYHFIRN